MFLKRQALLSILVLLSYEALATDRSCPSGWPKAETNPNFGEVRYINIGSAGVIVSADFPSTYNGYELTQVYYGYSFDVSHNEEPELGLELKERLINGRTHVEITMNDKSKNAVLVPNYGGYCQYDIIIQLQHNKAKH